MGNCCGNGTLPQRRIRRQVSRAQRESRIIKHKQQNFVRTLLENDEAKVGRAAVAPEFTQSVSLDDPKLRADKVDFTQYSYPFENLVFEGGGVKGLAYCGAVRVHTNTSEEDIVLSLQEPFFQAISSYQYQRKSLSELYSDISCTLPGVNFTFCMQFTWEVLEKLGLLSQIKRFAGSSSGAMTATLLAVGFNSYEIQVFLSKDLSKIFLDHSCGYCSVLPNLIRGYGWNPGKKIYRWFGKKLSQQTGNADITFSEIFEKYSKELCIIATNLNMMNAEYFHRKTTPDMPVRDAVRMSMAIPGITKFIRNKLYLSGLFQATQYEMNGQINTYIDGGVLCNYPIHCYDGWWLSMAMEDSFITKLEKLEDFSTLFEKKERFGKYNDKTLGFLLYSDNERDVFQNKLEQRVGPLPPYPETTLAGEARGKTNRREKVKHYHTKNLSAVSAFLKVLKKHNINDDDKIDKAELENALKDEEDFPQRYRERLFGQDVTVEEAMLALDKNNDGEIQYNELVQFVERTGVCLQAHFLGYNRQEIKGLFSFFYTLQSALLTNMKRIFVEERDIDRTVGINTGHVGTSDFKLEEDDRTYVVEQGQRSTEAFLRNYVIKNNLPPKSRTVSKTENNKTVIIVDNINRKDSKTVIQDKQNGRSTEAVAFNNKIAPVVEALADANGCVTNKLKTTTFKL